MDVSQLTALVKELNEANGAGKTEDVTRLMKKLQSEVGPTEEVSTEEVLRNTGAAKALGKLRQHSAPGVSTLAKEIVKGWKDKIDKEKKKRKRDDGEKDDTMKRVKAEGSSGAASPAAASASAPSPSDRRPKTEINDQPSSSNNTASSSKRPALSTIDSARTVPRTAKIDGVDKTLKAEDSDGEEVRDKCAVMIYDALAADNTAEKKIIMERAQRIEKAVFELMNKSTGNDYRGKMRSLFLNLKDKGNPGLRNEIVLGYVEAEKLVSMSKQEMASESVRLLNEKLASDNLFKAKAVGETEAETDAFKCGRCHQRKCSYYQMQTRSADEPMTTFVTCKNCGHRWKFS